MPPTFVGQGFESFGLDWLIAILRIGEQEGSDRGMASSTHFEHRGPGVYIICRSCSRRRGDVLVAPEGETFWSTSGGSPRRDISVSLTECPDHGPLRIDSRELAAAVRKARRLGRVVPLRATPGR